MGRHDHQHEYPGLTGRCGVPAQLDGSQAAIAAVHRVRFEQAEATVAFRTNQPHVLDDATATLYSYRTGPYGSAPWYVTVLDVSHVDAREWSEGFRDAPTVEVGPQLHARTRPVTGGELYSVDNHQTLIHADRHTGTITAYCHNAAAARYWAARLVRQAMTAQLLASGATYAHAAALSVNGCGIVIAGHRGRGKTTTLVAALRYLDGDYVTNDRLLLRAEVPTLVGYPWPVHMRAGIGTLLAFPDLHDLVPPDLRTTPVDDRWHHPHKISVEPHDFPRLLTTGILANYTRPQLMIWPHLAAGHHRPAAELVSRDEVLRVLLDTRLFMIDPDAGVSAHINHWLIHQPPAGQTDEQLRQCAAALATVPCFRIRAGGDPHALADQVADLLRCAESVTVS